jgi:hypothetical protein
MAPPRTPCAAAPPLSVLHWVLLLHYQACDRDRTGDLTLTKGVLCQLSYASAVQPPTIRRVLRQQAGDGARTRDIKLGRLALYQLSYSRTATCTATAPALPRWWEKDSNLRRREPADLQSAPVGRLGIPPNSHDAPGARRPACPAQADGESRTRNRLITNQVLCQLSYVSVPSVFRETLSINRADAWRLPHRGGRDAESAHRTGAEDTRAPTTPSNSSPSARPRSPLPAPAARP